MLFHFHNYVVHPYAPVHVLLFFHNITLSWFYFLTCCFTVLHAVDLRHELAYLRAQISNDGQDLKGIDNIKNTYS